MRLIIPAVALGLMSAVAVQASAQTAAPAIATPAPAAPAPATLAPAPSAPAGTAPVATPGTAPAPMAGKHAHRTLQERFDAANSTHDGHLTLDQAKAGMPGLAKHFDTVDKDKKGYVTMEDIHAYNSSRHAHGGSHHAHTAS